MRRRHIPWLLATVVVSIGVVRCGGGENDDAVNQSTPTLTADQIRDRDLGGNVTPDVLTDSEEATAIELALQDQQVVERLAGRPYVARVGRWTTTNASGERTFEGAAVTLFVEENGTYVEELRVEVDVVNGKVVAVYDGSRKTMPPE